MKKYSITDLAQFVDHTNLHANASSKDMKQLCDEAKEYHFKTVAINPYHTPFCREALAGTYVGVDVAVSFPLGQNTIAEKVAEAESSIENGATEIDYVVNLSEVKNRNYDFVRDEMRSMVSVCANHGVVSKVIFENHYLTEDEIVRLSEIAKDEKPDFIKTSTGFAASGAKIEDVELMKKTVGDAVKIKAAGGIRDLDTFIGMIKAGAERIGASSGIQIIEAAKERLEESGDSEIVI